ALPISETLRPRPAGALDVLRPSQYQVHDVFGHIVFGRGDESFNAFDAPGAVVIAVCLRPAGADIGTGVGFGQDHGGAPLTFDHMPGDLLIALVSVFEHNPGESRTAREHPNRGVGSEDELRRGPYQRTARFLPAEFFGDLETPPFGVHPRPVTLLE